MRDEATLRAWINGRQEKASIYAALSPLLKAHDTEVELTDVEAVVALHVDLDPRIGESQYDSKAHIATPLARRLPDASAARPLVEPSERPLQGQTFVTLATLRGPVRPRLRPDRSQ